MSDLINLFNDLISVDSVTGSESNFAAYILARLRPLVDHAQFDQFGNIYARKDGLGEPVFFAAHLDTVEPGRGIQTNIDGEHLVSEGTTILGADNKAAIAVYFALLQQLSTGNVGHRPIELIFTLSEEVGNFGAVNFNYGLLNATQGYCFDAVAPVGTIITASPFYERVDIMITGKEAHASKPEQALSVLPVMSELIDKIPVGRINETTLCNIGVVNAGNVRNTVPGQGSMMIEVRSFVESDLVAQLQIICGALNACREMFGNEYSYLIDTERENPGYYHRDNASLRALEFVESVMASLDITTQRIDSMAVSDANIFNNKGLLCINLGDGVEFAHSTRERILIGDLHKLVDICAELVT